MFSFYHCQDAAPVSAETASATSFAMSTRMHADVEDCADMAIPAESAIVYKVSLFIAFFSSCRVIS